MASGQDQRQPDPEWQDGAGDPEGRTAQEILSGRTALEILNGGAGGMIALWRWRANVWRW
jgi:hypothetical protein